MDTYLKKTGEPFFILMAIVLIAIVFAGFAPTYYLRPSTDIVLSVTSHLHGLIFSTWYLLYLTQSSLVSAGRVGLHMRLGQFSLMLVVAMLVTGYFVVKQNYAAGRGTFGGSPEAFTFVPLSDLFFFALLFGLGVANRAKADIHKRLMLLAGIAMILPASSRLANNVFDNEMVGLFIQIGLVLSLVIYDMVRLRRVHMVTIFGIVVIATRVGLIFTFAPTEFWAGIARSIF